jgi:hypothetical protein
MRFCGGQDVPGDDDAAGLREYADTVVGAIGNGGDLVLVGMSLGGFTARLVTDQLPVEVNRPPADAREPMSRRTLPLSGAAGMVLPVGDRIVDHLDGPFAGGVVARDTRLAILACSAPLADPSPRVRSGRRYPGRLPSPACLPALR